MRRISRTSLQSDSKETIHVHHRLPEYDKIVKSPRIKEYRDFNTRYPGGGYPEPMPALSRQNTIFESIPQKEFSAKLPESTYNEIKDKLRRCMKEQYGRTILKESDYVEVIGLDQTKKCDERIQILGQYCGEPNVRHLSAFHKQIGSRLFVDILLKPYEDLNQTYEEEYINLKHEQLQYILAEKTKSFVSIKNKHPKANISIREGDDDYTYDIIVGGPVQEVRLTKDELNTLIQDNSIRTIPIYDKAVKEYIEEDLNREQLKKEQNIQVQIAEVKSIKQMCDDQNIPFRLTTVDCGLYTIGFVKTLSLKENEFDNPEYDAKLHENLQRKLQKANENNEKVYNFACTDFDQYKWDTILKELSNFFTKKKPKVLKRIFIYGEDVDLLSKIVALLEKNVCKRSEYTVGAPLLNLVQHSNSTNFSSQSEYARKRIEEELKDNELAMEYPQSWKPGYQKCHVLNKTDQDYRNIKQVFSIEGLRYEITKVVRIQNTKIYQEAQAQWSQCGDDSIQFRDLWHVSSQKPMTVLTKGLGQQSKVVVCKEVMQSIDYNTEQQNMIVYNCETRLTKEEHVSLESSTDGEIKIVGAKLYPNYRVHFQ